MARGTKLSEFEKEKVSAFHEQGKSNREIAQLLGRSHCLVNNYLKNTADYGAKKTGRPSKKSDRDKRRIYRSASNSTSTSVKITSDLSLNVNSSTVKRAIYKNLTLVCRKMKRAPALTNIHRRLRLEFSRQNMNRDWSKAYSFEDSRYELIPTF
jgi:IS30 family transposase